MSARGAANVHRGRWISIKLQAKRVTKLTHSSSSVGRSTWLLVQYDGSSFCHPLRASLRSGVWVNSALVTRRSSGDSNHERFLNCPWMIRAIANERGYSSPLFAMQILSQNAVCCDFILSSPSRGSFLAECMVALLLHDH